MSIKNKKILLLSILVIGIIFYLFTGITSTNAHYFLPLRMKKILSLILVATSISYSTLTFQTITQSHLLTPSMMGFDSLYLFIQTTLVFFGGHKIVMMVGSINFFLSIGLMVLASTLFFHFFFKKKLPNIYYLLLTGLIFGMFFGGLSDFMQVMLDPNEFSILQGSMFASFSKVNVNYLFLSIAVSLSCIYTIRKDFSQLDVLTLGYDHALNLGINVKKTIKKHLIIVAILVSVSTVLVGPITFLGLLSISLARKLCKTYKHNIVASATTLISCIALLYGLWIVEKVFALGTTLSVVINFVGGIYFIIMLLKENQS